MWSRHPTIAKRWVAEFGSYEHPKGSQSNESPNPKIKRLPRHKPGDDFKHLTPSASKRFAPYGAPRPNQQESDKERGVLSVPGSRR